MIRTGTVCALTGIYRTVCSCSATARVGIGRRFPLCPECGEFAMWVFVHPTQCEPTTEGSDVTVLNLDEIRDEIAEAVADRASLVEALVRRKPSDEAALYGLSCLLLELGQPAGAAELLYDLINLRPQLASAYRELGKALLQEKLFSQAVEILERGSRVAEGNGEREKADEMRAMAKLAQYKVD